MRADEPTEDDLTRRLVDRSAALRAGTLDADCRALLQPRASSAALRGGQPDRPKECAPA